MKPALFSIALLLSLTFSCKKQAATTPFLTGKWRLVLMTGGIANVHLTAAQWGHTKSYIFDEKNVCTVAMDATITHTTYVTSRDTSYTSNNLANFVTISGTQKFEYSFAHDTLVLAQDIRVDGMTEMYVKEY